MSKRMKQPIVCPQCGERSDFLVWESINTTLEPEMKQAVRDGSAFAFRCSHCNHEASVDYGFLYHQMEDRIMIHYAQSDENAEQIRRLFAKDSGLETGVDSMMQDLRDHGYLIRIVRSREQLLEKLAIFDAGLDDRIIEVIKLLFLARLQEQDEHAMADELLMNTDPDGKHIVHFLAEGRGIATAEITEEMYRSVAAHFGSDWPDLREDDIIIDRQWALKQLNVG